MPCGVFVLKGGFDFPGSVGGPPQSVVSFVCVDGLGELPCCGAVVGSDAAECASLVNQSEGLLAEPVGASGAVGAPYGGRGGLDGIVEVFRFGDGAPFG